MLMWGKSCRTFGYISISLVTLLIVAACGGGNGETATPTSPPASPTPSDGGAPAPTIPSGEGVPTPEPWTGGEEQLATFIEAEMTEAGGSGQSGTVILVQIERKTKVEITITPGLGGPQKALVRRGKCGETGGKVDYLLFDVIDGKSISLINTPTQFLTGFSRNIIEVHAGPSESDPIASCGNLPSPFG